MTRTFLYGLTLLLITSALSVSSEAYAQTSQLAERKDVHGSMEPTPYITYSQLQKASIGGKATFKELSPLSSIDEAIRLLGHPESRERRIYEGEEGFVELDYEGMTVEYYKAPGSDYTLRTLTLDSPSNWYLKVNGTELYPGMDVSQLSSVVQRNLKSTLGEDLDQRGAVYVASPGTAERTKSGGKLEVLGRETSITVFTDKKTSTVKEVRFHRLK